MDGAERGAHMASNFTHAIVRRPSRSVVDGIADFANEGKPIYEKALEQHDAYIAALEEAGLEVTVLPALEEFPDSVFVEDTCIITPAGVVVDRPGAPSRLHEPDHMVPTLRTFFADEQIKFIEAPGTLEGGDVMMVDDHYYVGRSARTNDEGFRQFAAFLAAWGFTAEQVELERILHLKTGCTYLEDGRLLAAGEMWERPLYRESGRFSEIFHVPDAEAYAADAVRINDCVIMSAGYPSVRAQIGAWGYRVIELEMSEFRKIDGSITCLSLRW